MTPFAVLSQMPAGVVQVSDMGSIEYLAGDGGKIFTFSHLINPTLRATWYLTLVAGSWFGYNVEQSS